MFWLSLFRYTRFSSNMDSQRSGERYLLKYQAIECFLSETRGGAKGGRGRGAGGTGAVRERLARLRR